jgi:hypothetical protein
MKPSSARMYEAYLSRELIRALGAQPIADIRRREIVALLARWTDLGLDAGVLTVSAEHSEREYPLKHQSRAHRTQGPPSAGSGAPCTAPADEPP